MTYAAFVSQKRVTSRELRSLHKKCGDRFGSLSIKLCSGETGGVEMNVTEGSPRVWLFITVEFWPMRMLCAISSMNYAASWWEKGEPLLKYR